MYFKKKKDVLNARANFSINLLSFHYLRVSIIPKPIRKSAISCAVLPSPGAAAFPAWDRRWPALVRVASAAAASAEECASTAIWSPRLEISPIAIKLRPIFTNILQTSTVWIRLERWLVNVCELFIQPHKQEDVHLLQKLVVAMRLVIFKARWHGAGAQCGFLLPRQLWVQPLFLFLTFMNPILTVQSSNSPSRTAAAALEQRAQSLVVG